MPVRRLALNRVRWSEVTWFSCLGDADLA